MKWDGMGWIGSDGGIKKRAEPSQSSAVQTTKGASFQWGSVPARLSQSSPAVNGCGGRAVFVIMHCIVHRTINHTVTQMLPFPSPKLA